MSKVTFRDGDNRQQEVNIDVTDYREASDNNMSLSQLYQTKYPTNVQAEATTFEQMCASAGLRMRADKEHGIPASNMKEIMYGSHLGSPGPIVRPQGSDSDTPSSRILFPQVVMNLVESALLSNKEDYLAPWEGAIAMSTSVNSARVDQPKIDTTGPEEDAAQPISQLAEPAVMTRITLSDVAYNIPTKAIGLEISDQALEASTIDLVAISLASQARGERIRRIENDMAAMISGDIDVGIAASTFANGSTFDPLINAGTPITQLGWSKFLRSQYQTMNMTHVLMSLDTYFKIEARPGVTTVLSAPDGESQLPGRIQLANAGFPSPVILILPEDIVGADVALGFDSSKAMQEIINVSASYSAIENFVLRRAVSFRWDYGMILTKLHDDAFAGINLGA